MIHLPSDLKDEDISDDIECVKHIHKEQGFGYFREWMNCSSSPELSKLINQCLPSKT